MAGHFSWQPAFSRLNNLVHNIVVDHWLDIMNNVELANMNKVKLTIMNNVELAIMNNVELQNWPSKTTLTGGYHEQR